VFKYALLAVAVPSRKAAAARTAVTAVPATLIVAEEVNAVEGSKSTIVLVRDTFDAAAVPTEIAPVELAFSVEARTEVVFCWSVATVVTTYMRVSGNVNSLVL
jgi:hypothetical protein